MAPTLLPPKVHQHQPHFLLHASCAGDRVSSHGDGTGPVPCPHPTVQWQGRADPVWGGSYRSGLSGSSPPSNTLGWATRAHGLFQSLISRIRQKTIIKEPTPSGGSLLVSTERREYLADFFFHPANFRPLYNISFNTTQFL